MKPPVKAENLGVRFGRRTALDGLSLTVQPRSVYALLGPNGAGKTTTFRALLGLLRPDRGRAALFGVESERLTGEHRARLGVVSADLKLPGWMTARGFLRYLSRLYPEWDAAACSTLREELELPARQKIRRLSRGQKMKLQLLAALPHRPRLLLFDEPFAGLDPLVRRQVIDLLLRQVREWGATVLLASHELLEIEPLIDRLGFLQGGRLIVEEDLSELQERWREVEVWTPHEARLPGEIPPNWVQPEARGRRIRFFETQFAGPTYERALRVAFPAMERWNSSPLSLPKMFEIAALSGSTQTGASR